MFVSLLGLGLSGLSGVLTTENATAWWIRKFYPLRFSGNVYSLIENFTWNLTSLLYVILREIIIFYSITSKSDKAMPYWARSSSEFLHFPRKKSKIAISLRQYELSPQNSARRCTTCLWIAWLLKFQFQKSKTADNRHLQRSQRRLSHIKGVFFQFLTFF